MDRQVHLFHGNSGEEIEKKIAERLNPKEKEAGGQTFKAISAQTTICESSTGKFVMVTTVVTDVSIPTFKK